MADSSLTSARAAGIWLTLVTVESIHGVMRRLFLEPQLGDLRARQVSVFTGGVLIALVFWFTLGWLRPQPARRWWTFGLLWLALTLAFEIGLGLATGVSWDRIASDFDPRRGGLLGFGMLVILVAPRLLAQRRGLIQDGDTDARQTGDPHVAPEDGDRPRDLCRPDRYRDSTANTRKPM